MCCFFIAFRRIVSWLAVCVIAAANASCANRGSISAVALNTRQLPATGPLITTLHPREGWYFVNEKNELCIAIHGRHVSILGKLFESDFVVTMALSGVPADTSRDYQLGRGGVRMKFDQGLNHTRAASQNGIVTVTDYGKRDLRIRFRVVATLQSFNILTGWGGNTTVLYVGEIRASKNHEKCERLFARTEDVIPVGPAKSGTKKSD
ncbi:MAG: hypothetical protein HY287_17365 [Planctomycetes bacterium]|nr:hypothetical protein [Planctomycetota bacterium]MBI3836096.1 hypothetical protein [Planctomycetota bacterium]